MDNRSGVVESAMEMMPGGTKSIVEGSGHYYRWRHQKIGDRREESQNAMGADAEGMVYETTDYHKMATCQDKIFYTQFLPIKGDLIISLKGYPQTKQEARCADPVCYYRVDKITDLRRTEDGQLAYAKIATTIDNSGQWNGS